MILRMQTRQDLLRVINALKREELKESYHPYTMRQLGWFCNPNHVFHRYRDFEIPKKSGGKRLISAPGSHSYMHLLRYVGAILQSVYTPSANAMGFVPKRSIVDNAKAHIGQNYVFNIDLKDFFPSIERCRIVSRLQVRPFCFTPEVALTIAGLCTMRVANDEGAEKKYRYVLPQGSPASPVITNLMCDKLDFLLAKVAKRFGLTYTRYADDITFSSMHNVYQEGSDFRKELERIIAEQGFTINPKKTRLDKIGARQEVTGLTVSKDKVNVARKYIRDLRGLLYIWEKYGYATAESRMLAHHAKQEATRKKGTSLVCVVEGKLLFLQMVKGKNDPTFLKLAQRFEKLLGNDKRQPRNATVAYKETLRVPDFEAKYHTRIVVQEDKHHHYRSATCEIEGETVHIQVKKDIDGTRYTLPQLVISYCQNKEQSQSFWLLHVPYKSVHIQDAVDVDSLLADLDALTGGAMPTEGSTGAVPSKGSTGTAKKAKGNMGAAKKAVSQSNTADPRAGIPDLSSIEDDLADARRNFDPNEDGTPILTF